ncbi:CatA-like O-acetyltransferase [Flammeovirga sp. SubArs3]|uniref:CatA-like O-acetyltransferase n=1 Tax=Flammeovirga sp. SubArs3 TaxID=2995316 RepID=UPI00248B75CE|nr:CatA-like O-acetyltransferase [Flammeovirga sp. SubArs3]
MKEQNIDQWKRKEQYLFFKDYLNPNFSLTANVCIDGLIHQKKQNNASLHHLYHFYMLKVMNEIEEFRYRIINDKVYYFDEVYGGTTILKEDKTFTFCYLDWYPDFDRFTANAKKAIDAIKKGNAFELKENDYPIIHCTTIPWVAFTNMSNPLKDSDAEFGIPKVTFGKIFQQEGKNMLPICVQAHHSLVDGYHMGQFFDRMEKYCSV